MIPQIQPLMDGKEAELASMYLTSGRWLTEDRYTHIFEQNIEEFIDTDFCSLVPNGTMALVLSLLAVRIKPRDKVIVPALTMIATANAVRFIGAEPVFADVTKNGCLRLNSIPDDVKAVIYVSLNGSSDNLENIERMCINEDVWLIEDSCQAFGSKHGGRNLGTFGDVGVFSFSPHKIITTGQGGAIVTNSKWLHDEVERLKDHGREVGGVESYPYFGINAKFTDLQAIIGSEQLIRAENRLKKKKEILGWYKKHSYETVFDNCAGDNIPWFVGIYANNPQQLKADLFSNGIGSREMYPVVPHQPCYGIQKPFPIAEELSKKILWLPSSVNLVEDVVKHICQTVRRLNHG